MKIAGLGMAKLSQNYKKIVKMSISETSFSFGIIDFTENMKAFVLEIFFFRFEEKFQNSTDCTTGLGDGSTSREAYISAIIIGFVRLLASLLLSKLLRKFRRRSMYFASAILTIISLISFAICTIFIER